MSPFTPGPGYREMLYPDLQPRAIRELAASASSEFDPIHLFDISWRAADGRVRHAVLPPEITGVDANIIVLEGCHFPSGSHKVGAAYAILMEAELAGEISPGARTAVGPSSGNFGIGVAYIARLKGYSALIVMPEGMSTERHQRIRQYGGRLDLTPADESTILPVMRRAAEYRRDPRYFVLAQFENLANYRFHRYVTGNSAIEAAAGYGNGRIAAFVSAPGSGGTIGAGDGIQSRYPDALVCAAEPKECSTLFDNGRGTHRVQGVGDEMVTFVHNVLSTDYVIRIHDDDCVIGLELLERRQPLIEQLTGCAAGCLAHLTGIFGVSGICNLLGAIRLARQLRLPPGENVVTIATDSFDRYPSVLEDLAQRRAPLHRAELSDCFDAIFRAGDSADLLDVRPPSQKERLFAQKEEFWSQFGYRRGDFARMRSQSFWDAAADAIPAIDEKLAKARHLPAPV